MNLVIPMIRRVLPRMVAQSIVGAQPMAGGAGDIFNLRHCVSTDIKEPRQGDRRHSFIYGWQRYYGTQWIAEYLWFNIKLKGL